MWRLLFLQLELDCLFWMIWVRSCYHGYAMSDLTFMYSGLVLAGKRGNKLKHFQRKCLLNRSFLLLLVSLFFSISASFKRCSLNLFVLLEAETYLSQLKRWKRPTAPPLSRRSTWHLLVWCKEMSPFSCPNDRRVLSNVSLAKEDVPGFLLRHLIPSHLLPDSTTTSDIFLWAPSSQHQLLLTSWGSRTDGRGI